MAAYANGGMEQRFSSGIIDLNHLCSIALGLYQEVSCDNLDGVVAILSRASDDQRVAMLEKKDWHVFVRHCSLSVARRFRHVSGLLR